MRVVDEPCNPAAVSEQVSLNADRVSRFRVNFVIASPAVDRRYGRTAPNRARGEVTLDERR